MKRMLSFTCCVITLLCLAGCSSSSNSAELDLSGTVPDGVSISWHEIGEGPAGWVIGIYVENNTGSQYTQDAVVTVTADNGNVLGEDTVNIDVAPNDYYDYPVHCQVSDSYHVTLKPLDPVSNDVTPEHPDTSSGADDRGIPGMDPSALLTLLTGDPFYIPTGELVAVDDAENTYCAYTCTSTGGGEGSGVMYDYSLSLDSDEEIVGSSFGIISTTANEEELLVAADLFFYAVSLLDYDTADSETLSAWFTDNLEHAGSDAIETTLGDATFQLYGIPGNMYWVDISKA